MSDSVNPSLKLPELSEARIESERLAVLKFDDKVEELPKKSSFVLLPGGIPDRVFLLSGNEIGIEAPFSPTQAYKVKLTDGRSVQLFPHGILDKYYSDTALGLSWDGERAIFR